jgi:hypothetical protein
VLDAPLSELADQIDYALRGCQRYLLKGVIQINLREIATQAKSEPQLATKALQTADAMKEVDSRDRSELGNILGLNPAQMRSLFDETLSDARTALQRSQLANFATLGAGLLLFLVTAGISLFGHSANAWTLATGGMGAAATIAALITSPSRQIGSGVSRLIYVQTAYFSFLTQVRLLNSLSPDTAIQRSERLGEATDKLLAQLRSLPGDQATK